MKKKFKNIAIVFFVLTMMAFTVLFSEHRTDSFTELTLANIEAFSQDNELDGGYNVIHIKLYGGCGCSASCWRQPGIHYPHHEHSCKPCCSI